MNINAYNCFADGMEIMQDENKGDMYEDLFTPKERDLSPFSKFSIAALSKPTFNSCPTESLMFGAPVFKDDEVFKDEQWSSKNVSPGIPASSNKMPRNIDLNEQVNELVDSFKPAVFEQTDEPSTRKSSRNDLDKLGLVSVAPLEHQWSKTSKSSFHQKSGTSVPIKVSNICNGPYEDEEYSEISESKCKPKRWGKEEDKIMVHKLLKACSIYQIDVGEFAYPTSMDNHLHYKLLLNLKREMGWVGTTRQILKRVCILRDNPHLSVRDTRALRKLVKQQLMEGELNIDLLIYNFPCKNINEIKGIANKVKV